MLLWLSFALLSISAGLVAFFEPQWAIELLKGLFPSVVWDGTGLAQEFRTPSATKKRRSPRDRPAAEKPLLALTIDDVPARDCASTLRLLKLLEIHGAKATFMVISRQATGQEHILDQILQAGHELGNHMPEDRPSILYSKADFEKKFLECDAFLRRFERPRTINAESKEHCDGQRLRWFRPGSGWFNKRIIDTVERHGYRLVLGNIYPHDPQIRCAAILSFHLRHRARAGGIVILHDRPWTADALERCLGDLSERFQIVTLTELSKAEAAGAADFKSR